MVELHDHSCRFTSVIGNTTIAELETTPKDSDLVGGASSPCTWCTVTVAKAQREFGLFGVTSATVEPSFSEPPYTQPLTTKTRPARPAHVLPYG